MGNFIGKKSINDGTVVDVDGTNHINKLRQYIKEHTTLPELAKTLDKSNTFLQALGDVTIIGEHIPIAKTVGMALTEVVSLIHNKQKKKIKKELVKQIGNLEKLEQEGFQDLKETFVNSKEDIGLESLDILRNMHYLDGCDKINKTFKSLVDSSNKDHWASEFRNYISEFRLYSGDFSDQNKLGKYLSKIFQEQCSESLNALNKAYNYFLKSRIKYLLIMTTYYAHFPDSAFKEDQGLDINKEAERELLLACQDGEVLNKVIKEICWFFFLLPNKISPVKNQLKEVMEPLDSLAVSRLREQVTDLQSKTKNLEDLYISKEISNNLKTVIRFANLYLEEFVAAEDPVSRYITSTVDELLKIILIFDTESVDEFNDNDSFTQQSLTEVVQRSNKDIWQENKPFTERLKDIQAEDFNDPQKLLKHYAQCFEEEVVKDLMNVYNLQCKESFTPLFEKYASYITSRLCYSIKKTQLSFEKENSNNLTQILEAIIDLCHDLKMLHNAGYKIIPAFFHHLRILKLEENLKPGFLVKPVDNSKLDSLKKSIEELENNPQFIENLAIADSYLEAIIHATGESVKKTISTVEDIQQRMKVPSEAADSTTQAVKNLGIFVGLFDSKPVNLSTLELKVDSEYKNILSEYKFLHTMIDSKIEETEFKEKQEKLTEMIECISENRLIENLNSTFTKKCTNSLKPLFDKYDDFISNTVMLFSIKTQLIFKNQKDDDLVANLVEATTDLCQCLKMLFDVGYKIIPGLFHPLRILKPEWKFKPERAVELKTSISMVKQDIRFLNSLDLTNKGLGSTIHEQLKPQISILEKSGISNPKQHSDWISSTKECMVDALNLFKFDQTSHHQSLIFKVIEKENKDCQLILNKYEACKSDKKYLNSAEMKKEEEKVKKLNLIISEKNCLEVLNKIYTTQCTESLKPLFNKYDDFYTSTVMLYIIKTELIMKNQNPVDILTKIPEAAVDLCDALKMLYEVGYKIIPDFFHELRTIHPEWKIKPGYIPLIDEIPDTDENYLGEFTDHDLFENNDVDHNNKVYGPRNAMIDDKTNFIRLKTLREDKYESIVSIKSGRCLDGLRRIRFTNGAMSYGTYIYARNGNKETLYRLYKYTDGRYDYHEIMYENGLWKYPLNFRFNESSMTWTKR